MNGTQEPNTFQPQPTLEPGTSRKEYVPPKLSRLDINEGTEGKTAPAPGEVTGTTGS